MRTAGSRQPATIQQDDGAKSGPRPLAQNSSPGGDSGQHADSVRHVLGIAVHVAPAAGEGRKQAQRDQTGARPAQPASQPPGQRQAGHSEQWTEQVAGGGEREGPAFGEARGVPLDQQATVSLQARLIQGHAIVAEGQRHQGQGEQQ